MKHPQDDVHVGDEVAVEGNLAICAPAEKAPVLSMRGWYGYYCYPSVISTILISSVGFSLKTLAFSIP
jgi:hypothetical protein